VELVAVLPFVALLAMLLWQAAVAGQSAWLAASAARSAARAHAVGLDGAAAARGSLPPRLEHGLLVRSGSDGSVRVRVGVPSVVGAGRLAVVRAEAHFEPQGRGS
jgi:hypothetical protein